MSLDPLVRLDEDAVLSRDVNAGLRQLGFKDEAQFQLAVIDLARVLRWCVAHFRPALRKSGRWSTPVAADGAGFPDLVLVRDRVIFAEIKGDKGRVSPAQDAWASALEHAGAEHYVWFPTAWYCGTIESTLRRDSRSETPS